MRGDSFSSTRAGRVIRVNPGPGSYLAFHPEPIPRELELSSELLLALSEADQALGLLAGLGRQLPNPHILIQPYVRREAVASTRIEGTQSTLSEVLSAEAQLAPETTDTREVLNYVRALERGLRLLPTLPVSGRLIREMHAELMRGVRGNEGTPGEFRRTQNWIGGRGPSDAVFVPPPPYLLNGVLGDFENYLHESPTLPVLVRTALVHYQFETIHPFLDGNGRLGRLLIVFYLVERGVLPQPLLYLSAFLERNRDEYVAHLQAIRERGDYESWVIFFLHGVTAQARAAVRTSEALLGLASEFRDRLRRARARGVAVDAVEGLIGNPYVSAPRIASSMGVTRQGAAHVIDTLERARIVTPVVTATRPNLYVAAEVLAALEDDGSDQP